MDVVTKSDVFSLFVFKEHGLLSISRARICLCEEKIPFPVHSLISPSHSLLLHITLLADVHHSFSSTSVCKRCRHHTQDVVKDFTQK